MKSYGKFEAVREIFQTPYAAIWTARPVATDGGATACIKLLQPDAPVFSGKGQNGAEAAEELLVAAALQQSIANKSEHWAPVYGLGYDGKTAFYITRLFDRSLQRLIDAKVRLSSSDLLAIVSAIVEGLIDLRSAFDRAHGNVKPTNVLLAGKGRIRREDVRLTDPNSADQDVPSPTRSPDVKAIGEIIFALVTGRPHHSARWPVPESAEWKRLGASGGQWLALCNDLLNTMARQGPMSLGKIQARLNSVAHTRRRTPRGWLAMAAVIGLVAGGYFQRDRLLLWSDKGKQWTANFSHPQKKLRDAPVTSRPTSDPPFALIGHDPVRTNVPTTNSSPAAHSLVENQVIGRSGIATPPTINVPIPDASTVKSVADATAPQIQPDSIAVRPPPATVPSSLAAHTTDPAFAPKPEVTVTPQLVITPATQASVAVVIPEPAILQPATLAVTPRPPAFLPHLAADRFTETVNRLSDPASSDQRAKFASSVNALDGEYPAESINGDRAWQKELSKLVSNRREGELILAVGALADALPIDATRYTSFASGARQFSIDAAGAEDAINAGQTWTPDANAALVRKALKEEDSLLEEPHDRATAAPAVLEEIRAVNDVVAAQNPKSLLTILHDQNSSLPARVAAWQALDLPDMHGLWPASRDEFAAGQKDGDSLVAAAAGSSIETRAAISDVLDRRLQSFYASLATEPAVTDALLHLPAIEGNRARQRPRWLEFDRILYSLTVSHTAPSDADLKQLKALNDIPLANSLYATLQSAKNAASNDHPLQGVGPGLNTWAARPFSSSGIQGCVYSHENCSAIEFIRVEPAQGKGLPFYLSTTEVPVGLIMAVLADSTLSNVSATDALKALNPQSPTPGAHVWKFAVAGGIELDSSSYLQYFRQAPTADLPMQQITPQAALYLARDLGCRLPSSGESQAALAFASHPTDAENPMKGFATSGWKLRDIGFTSLVDKASLTQHFPDEGIFLGPDPSIVPIASAAVAWPPALIHKLGGWTVSDLKTDREGQRQMARLDERSSDFRADLVEPPQNGFRPVGTAHHVFHDLIGNVAEFVLDAPAAEIDPLPVGMHVSQRDISDFFAAPDRIRHVGVMGGSFLSPPELDPMARIPLPATASRSAYADVGFRLAFTDPKVLADPNSVIRHTGYLYPAPSVKSTPPLH